jgi:hypothetical protein
MQLALPAGDDRGHFAGTYALMFECEHEDSIGRIVDQAKERHLFGCFEQPEMIKTKHNAVYTHIYIYIYIYIHIYIYICIAVFY